MTNLNGFVTVGTVVDYGQRLLEAGTSNTNNISYQLTDSDHHLKDKEKDGERKKIKYCKILLTVPFTSVGTQQHKNKCVFMWREEGCLG